MIKVIVGSKGSGKTARLVDDLNAHANMDNTNVVCIEAGQRLGQMVKYKIRLVDIREYPVQGYEQLLSFIAGICAKDYDVTHIYIDSITKITTDRDLTHLDSFLTELEVFAEKEQINVMIVLSAEPEHLPKGIVRFCS